MTDTLDTRSARAVLEDHLKLAYDGDLDTDLERNYAAGVVFLSGRGIYHGHEGARALTVMLAKEVPDAVFVYTTVQVHGRMGYLEWTAAGGGRRVRDGADSYLIENGKIVAQTIHYTVEPPLE